MARELRGHEVREVRGPFLRRGDLPFARLPARRGGGTDLLDAVVLAQREQIADLIG
jgi:hypothetical protein